MQKLPLFVISFSLLTVSAVTWADDDVSGTPAYVGVGLGHASVDRGSVALSGADSGGINGTSTSRSLFGGYYFTDNFGAELGYHDYGSPTAFTQAGFVVLECPASFSCPKISGETAEVLGKMELVPQLDGILRAGLLEWNVGSPGGTLLGKTSGSAFIYGVGVRYRLSYGLSFDATYERSSFTTEETRIGLSYSF
ncbi:MAG TPA: outer membrane beta-barrel protein [Gammaproteobacteria bacterium]|jgi:opacity protein-like surface antigen